jgi:hypothetical protein
MENEKTDKPCKNREKIFLKNEDALRYCKALKRKGKYPYKTIIVSWEE